MAASSSRKISVEQHRPRGLNLLQSPFVHAPVILLISANVLAPSMTACKIVCLRTLLHQQTISLSGASKISSV